MKNQVKELRVKVDARVVEQLQILADLGNFSSLSAAAAHIVTFYTAPTVAGMKESQEIVRKTQAAKGTGLVV